MAHFRILSIRDDLTYAELLELATNSNLKPAQQYESSDSAKQYTAITDSLLFENNLSNIQNLEFQPENNKFILTKTNGDIVEFELNQYLDDTNISRIVSGSLNGTTGIATFGRDDTSEFTIDFAPFLADLNYKGSITDQVSLNGKFIYSDGDTLSPDMEVDLKVLPNVEVDYIILTDSSVNNVKLKVYNNNGVLETVISD